MSANVDGSDKQTLLDATQGLGFVEGRTESVVFLTFNAVLPSLRLNTYTYPYHVGRPNGRNATDCIDKTMSHCQVMVSRMALRPHTAIFGGRHSPRSALRL